MHAGYRHGNCFNEFKKGHPLSASAVYCCAAAYNHAGNRYLNESAAKIRARVELLSTTYYDNENIKKIHESHLEIYTAVQNKDFDKASNLMREHLQHSMMYALKGYATYKKSEK